MALTEFIFFLLISITYEIWIVLQSVSFYFRVDVSPDYCDLKLGVDASKGRSPKEGKMVSPTTFVYCVLLPD